MEEMLLVEIETKTNEARLRELEREMDVAARCSGGAGGGCSSPTLAKWYVMFCPSYGQN